MRFGIEELAFSQLVFATDYPQAVREAGEVAAYVEAVRGLGANGRALAAGANAEKLIPDLAPAARARARARSQGARMNDKPAIARRDAFDPAAHGWEEVVKHTAFGDLVGPIWRREDGERLRFGFVVAPKHLNRAGNLHGGMLMTLADQAMAMTARRATGGKRTPPSS